MALTHVRYPFAIKLPSPEITHITTLAPSRGQETVVERQAGSPAPCFVGVSRVDPSIPFSSRQLKSILDTIGSADIDNLSRNLSASTVQCWYRSGKSLETRALDTESVHIVGELVESSMLYWRSIRATQGQVAEMEATIVTAQTSPSAVTMRWLGSQQLPSRNGCQRIYGLGPCFLDGSQLSGITSVNITSNVTLEPISGDGDISNTYHGIRDFHVQAELSSNNIDEVVNSSLGGDAYSTLEIYLKRMTSTNVFAANNVAEHIRLTLVGGLKTVDGITGNSPASTSLMFYTVDPAGAGPSHYWDTATTIA